MEPKKPDLKKPDLQKPEPKGTAKRVAAGKGNDRVKESK